MKKPLPTLYISWAHILLVVIACIAVDSWPVRAIMIALFAIGLIRLEG